MDYSVSTIDNIEFIDLQPTDVTKTVSKCTVKILYTGTNRNGSFISDDAAIKMAKNLRGCPIVGAYSKEKGDFTGHGDKITIDDEGVKFERTVVPFGFVSLDAKIWFQEIEEKNSFGEIVKRKYMFTEGLLWTRFFEEAKKALEGRPQSMELDSNTMDGHWEYNQKDGIEYFIINDAEFLNLCILGEDVEPCFEGANVKGVTTSFALDTNFKDKIISLAKEFVEKEGIYTMGENSNNKNTQTTDNSIVVKENPVTYTKEQYEQLNHEFEEVKAQFAKFKTDIYEPLKKEYEELKEYKKVKESAEKDELIAQFTSLTDDEKKEVVSNKDKYTLDEIKAKLSIVFFDKSQKGKKELPQQKEKITSYTLDCSGGSIPDWINAIKQIKDVEKDN